jgi:hypothetical protein
MDGDPMSAYLADECGEPSNALDGHDGYGLVAFSVEAVRQRGLIIVRKETPGPRGHVLIVGKKTGSIRKHLKKNSSWIVRAPL